MINLAGRKFDYICSWTLQNVLTFIDEWSQIFDQHVQDTISEGNGKLRLTCSIPSLEEIIHTAFFLLGERKNDKNVILIILNQTVWHQ